MELHKYQLWYAHRYLPLVGHGEGHLMFEDEMKMWQRDLNKESSDTIYWFVEVS